MLTQEKLKKLLHYDPQTGVMTWLMAVGNVKKGAQAGHTNNHGYVCIKIEGQRYKAHRLAWLYMTGQWPQDKIDHRDHIRDRNVWSNLREASDTTNNKNATKRHDNTSNVTGISWDKENSKWRASINVDGLNKNLGRFINKHKAIAVRKAAEVAFDYHPNHGQ